MGLLGVFILLCLLLVAVVPREGQANVSFVRPKPLIYSELVTAYPSKQNQSVKKGDTPGAQQQHAAEIPKYEQHHPLRTDGFNKQETNLFIIQALSNAQALVIMLLSALCLCLPPDRGAIPIHLPKWIAELNDVFCSGTSFGVMLIGLSIALAVKPVTSSACMLGPDNCFALGCAICIVASACGNLLGALITKNPIKKLVLVTLTLIFGLLPRTASRVALKSGPWILGNIYSGRDSGVAEVEAHSAFAYIFLLFGLMSIWFTGALVILTRVEFDRVSVSGIASILLLQALLAGTSVLESVACLNRGNILPQACFSFMFSILALANIVTPRFLHVDPMQDVRVDVVNEEVIEADRAQLEVQ